jgi:DNA-binding transcriptional ArsR family regulator
MLGVVEGAPGPHDLDSVLGWLEDQDPAWLRERLMSEQFCDFDQSLVAAASGGNPEAVEKLLADPQMDHKELHFKDALRQSFALDSTETVSGLIEVLRRARSEGFGPYEKEWTSALERDAVDKRIAVASASSPRELVETVSNGISYEIPPGVRRLVIVPSVSLRPWTLITDFGDGLLVCCPVSEEALNSDPEAPPAWLVATYRALGDEKRLRLLRRLADGPASLAELTEHMGMAKSTVFHHIGVLRAAGLVRVLLGPDKESTNYSLRTDSIPDRDSLIDLYLQPPRKEVKS